MQKITHKSKVLRKQHFIIFVIETVDPVTIENNLLHHAPMK